MNTPKIIGLVGYKGSGKTSLTDHAICDPQNPRDPLHIMRLGFSAPIINMLLALGVPLDIVENKKLWDTPLDLLCGRTLRHAAQTVGTEWGRECISPDIWFNIGLRNANECVRSGISVVFDNVRFPDEFEKLRDSGTILIAFHRPGLVVDTSHESEQHIAKLQRDCDIAFDNVGLFNDAARSWRTILSELTTR